MGKQTLVKTIERSVLKKYIGTFLVMLIAANVEAQTCVDNVEQTTPTVRFSVNSDGTVKDNQTGLIWMRCVLGQVWNGSSCDGNASFLNWQDSLSQAENLVFSGKNDWRLPNIKELTSIVEFSCYKPAINLTVFSSGQIDSNYWSATTVYSFVFPAAWIVSVESGRPNEWLKDYEAMVRLVRFDD